MARSLVLPQWAERKVELPLRGLANTGFGYADDAHCVIPPVCFDLKAVPVRYLPERRARLELCVLVGLQ